MLEFDSIDTILVEGGDVEIVGCTIFTIASSKMRNAVRWLKLLEDTGIRKDIPNRSKVG